MKAWQIVFRKELRETLRDRRTLLVMIVVPVMLYPVLLITMEQLLIFGMRNLEAEASPVAVVGEGTAGLEEVVGRFETLRLVTIGEDLEEAIRSDSVTAVASIRLSADAESNRDVVILFDAAADRSLRGRGELSLAVEEWEDSLLARRLDDSGLTRSFAEPVSVSDSSVARAEELGGYTLGRILPLLLVIMTLLGAFYPAIDLAAGEHERGTLETLLTAPLAPRDVVIGKFMTVALIGVVAAGLNLASMLLTVQTGILQATAILGLEVSISPLSVLVIFLTLVPLAVLFGALFLGIAVGSSSFKEAQNALTPVYMLVIIPAMLPIFPGIEFSALMAILPVAGVSFLFRDLMAGGADPVLGTVVLVMTSLYALAALTFAARAFGSERTLFGAGSGDPGPAGRSLTERLRASRARASVPSSGGAVLFIALTAVAFFWGGVPLQIAFGEIGLLAAEWLLLFVPAVAFVTVGGFDLRSTLSLKRPMAGQMLAAALVILGVMPLVWTIGWLQTFILPVPWELLEGLEELVRADTMMRLVWLLLLLAVTPAICEEIVFRGVLLGGTRGLEPWRVIVLNGVIFGAFHLSFETVIRFLPTAVLGMVITWSVLRTGSIWIGALMHLLNNGTIVVLASIPALGDLFSDPDRPPPLWLMPLALVIFAAGVHALRLMTDPPVHGLEAREPNVPSPETP